MDPELGPEYINWNKLPSNLSNSLYYDKGKRKAAGIACSVLGIGLTTSAAGTAYAFSASLLVAGGLAVTGVGAIALLGVAFVIVGIALVRFQPADTTLKQRKEAGAELMHSSDSYSVLKNRLQGLIDKGIITEWELISILERDAEIMTFNMFKEIHGMEGLKALKGESLVTMQKKFLDFSVQPEIIKLLGSFEEIGSALGISFEAKARKVMSTFLLDHTIWEAWDLFIDDFQKHRISFEDLIEPQIQKAIQSFQEGEMTYQLLRTFLGDVRFQEHMSEINPENKSLLELYAEKIRLYIDAMGFDAAEEKYLEECGAEDFSKIRDTIVKEWIMACEEEKLSPYNLERRLESKYAQYLPTIKEHFQRMLEKLAENNLFVAKEKFNRFSPLLDQSFEDLIEIPFVMKKLEDFKEGILDLDTFKKKIGDNNWNKLQKEKKIEIEETLNKKAEETDFFTFVVAYPGCLSMLNDNNRRQFKEELENDYHTAKEIKYENEAKAIGINFADVFLKRVQGKTFEEAMSDIPEGLLWQISYDPRDPRVIQWILEATKGMTFAEVLTISPSYVLRRDDCLKGEPTVQERFYEEIKNLPWEDIAENYPKNVWTHNTCPWMWRKDPRILERTLDYYFWRHPRTSDFGEEKLCLTKNYLLPRDLAWFLEENFRGEFLDLYEKIKPTDPNYSEKRKEWDDKVIQAILEHEANPELKQFFC